MSNKDLVLGFLKEIYPNSYCDDCLSVELSIEPRQQVNQICGKLKDKGQISRENHECVSCGKMKIVNTFELEVTAESPLAMSQSTNNVEIQQIRREIISILQKIWAKNKTESEPYGLAEKINILKRGDLIPSHQANMMLTINGIRNSFEYEKLELGEEEQLIIVNAWKIIEKWWRKSGF